ncbi:metallohydrolase [Methylobacterium haplocladii]|uniref:Metallohydrolase n=1 Tax=Methylobacterium haplocladii TaxID=1176176 RepID=A0A512ISN4_9HYPH|nr:metallohydrolase [Methylobacterium haplocladii]GEP00724.1 hypothetical protein MHA02_31110 [Methylobacterium haplocladii]GJD82417.1 hypothetical protein HPGCJGGD_0271 [Methylobacterium haplocladii]GLS59549.1 hypothetical protein GCM10007887_22180 [Methylobacterium haplocladii]
MKVTTTHFQVGNGDMTLVTLESGRRILIDCKITQCADDPDDDAPDVGTQLRDMLERDGSDRLYVDAFLLTHPDQDHCAGLRRHFHLGPLSQWSSDDDKIVIREMWSSPIVFRRAERKEPRTPLCEDALAWRTEARRRANLFKAQGYAVDGDRILILGEDIGGKTDHLTQILVAAGSTFSRICGVTDSSFKNLLLAPLLASSDDEADVLSKNNSSVIMRMSLSAGGNAEAARYLLGGDAEVAIWEKIWDRYEPEQLAYEVLLAPHHCSWHSLSWDSWSEKRERARVSQKARDALGQAAPGAHILSSSCEIKDNENDPPCIRAKREYLAILKPGCGALRCVADEPDDKPLEMQVTYYGPKPSRWATVAGGALGTGVGTEALGHG